MEPIKVLADIDALERVPFEERLPAATVYEAIGRVAQRHPEKVAIYYLPTASVDDTPVTYTYAALFRRITQTANLLHELGVGEGDVVSSLLPIIPEAFFVLWAAEAIGIGNPINPFLETPHVTGILREAQSKVLVGCDPSILPDLWPKAEAARRELPGLKAVLRVGGGGADDFMAAIDHMPGDRLLAKAAPGGDKVAALFHTGGTTGLPKLARQTHRGQMLSVWTGLTILGSDENSVTLNGLPLFHVGGALVGGLIPFCTGSTVVMLSPLGMRNPNALRDYFRIAQRYRATALGMVPTVWAALLNVPADGLDLGSVRTCFSGASTMPVEVARAVERKLGKKLFEGYGMTEVHGYTAMNPIGGESRIGSVGFRVPYTEFLIARLRSDGSIERSCAAGEIGAVLMRGPQLFQGYVNPKHNEGAFLEGGWFNSGDLGRLDAEGYIWLTGRAKDLIIRGGHNIDPLQIEEVLYQHPEVEGAAAVGRPDRHAGEIPVAYVQLRPKATVGAPELLDFARSRIHERAAAPAEIHILPALPVTNVGKVFKPQLRFDAAKRTLERELAPLAAKGVRVDVTVGPDRSHGTLARVRLIVPKGANRAALTSATRELLGGFQLRHELLVEESS
ncbi:MAG TPA: acyl-CoA synthetase [Stellaceae bacterium]|nr:acyl-CoA synthetase [Stellaceae bacterium]